DQLMETDWKAYGLGRDPRCDTCMMHCGYEGSAIQEAMSSPRAFVEMVRRSSRPGVAKKARELERAAASAVDPRDGGSSA
ncbi:MAG: DUF3463 domain-containing protein, partial [Chloroflexi bacterium]|nr:DUF3463 domain-containing protein [Chloroflexota bacterium]